MSGVGIIRRFVYLFICGWGFLGAFLFLRGFCSVWFWGVYGFWVFGFIEKVEVLYLGRGERDNFL